MKGSVSGKVVDWEAGETMDQMLDKFGPWDYTVFGVLLLVSSAIGVYFAWRDRRNEGTVAIFMPHLGTRKMIPLHQRKSREFYKA